MADSPQIQGFDADAVRAGLRLAMTVGLPPIEEDLPIFYMPVTSVVNSGPADQQGVPLTPTGIATSVRPPPIRNVTCAVEWVDGQGKLENFGMIVPSKVVLTFLDTDYAKVEGFEFVVMKGNRYWYRNTESPKGLVTVGLFRVHCVAEDEG